MRASVQKVTRWGAETFKDENSLQIKRWRTLNRSGLRGQKRSQEKIEGDFKKEWGIFSVTETKGIKISRKEWPTEVTGAQR